MAPAMATVIETVPNVPARLPAERFDRPLRVCHVSLTLKTGGLERILCDLARHHRRECTELSFVAMSEVGRFAEEIRRTECPVHALQSRGRWSQLRELVQFFRAGRFDVVHAHNTYPHLYASLAARWAGVPVVVSTRHGQRAGQRWWATLKYRWMTALVDRVVAVSHDAEKLSVTVDGLPAAKVQTIWNGIDLNDFQYRGPVSQPIGISVARLSAEKDFPTLLRAVQLAAQRVPGLKLRLVGDGPERPALERLTDELQLRDQVEFLGDRADVPELLSTAAFFVTSSLTEGISLTLLEAMAAGLPVIATAVGGNPEIVVPEQTGLLCAPSDPSALAAHIERLCRHPETGVAWGLAGRDRVTEWFDVRRMSRDYEQLYLQLLSARSRKTNTARLGHARDEATVGRGDRNASPF
jgi:glycosyltransferase involved in cell wall biosynthesis